MIEIEVEAGLGLTEEEYFIQEMIAEGIDTERAEKEL